MGVSVIRWPSAASSEWLDTDVTQPGQLHKLTEHNPRAPIGTRPSMAAPVILSDHCRPPQTLQPQAERLDCFPSALCRALPLRALEPLEASDLEVA